MRLLWLLFIAAPMAKANQFDEYSWRVTFRPGSGFYQCLLKIDYRFEGSGSLNSADLALPGDSNLTVLKMMFKVDGQKVEPVRAHKATYWSQGMPTPCFVPPTEGSKVHAEAVYVIRNLFVIPPAPTQLSLPIKKLEVGFAPIAGFIFAGKFTGKQWDMKRNRIAARPGEPSYVIGFKKKNQTASSKTGDLFYLIPKHFQFSFTNLVGVSEEFDLVADANRDRDSALPLDANQLKPYSMVFYRENPARDWAYAPTWLQQDEIYLPFGMEPGGRTRTRSLFKGAGDNTDDLMPWRMDYENEDFFEELPNDIDVEFDGMFPAIEAFLDLFRGKVPLDPNLGAMIVDQNQQGALSSAAANLVLATQLSRRLGLRTVPALLTRHKKALVPSLPLAGFSRVLTGFKHKGSWYFIDAADPTWKLKNSFAKLEGYKVLILDGTNLQIAEY